VVPWVKLGSALVPDGTELSLWQRGKDLVIRCGVGELMSTRVHGSEELLAEHGCAELGPRPCVFIGGLGMAFTLRATIALLPRDGTVVVSEICPAVVDWCRGPIGASDLLDDPRVTVDVRDASVVLAESEGRFDSIMLDVDNGPRALTQEGNWRLYDRKGLGMIKRALKPSGRLAVWSAGDDHLFEGELLRAGFFPQTLRVRARGAKTRGPRHIVFLGLRRAPLPAPEPEPRDRGPRRAGRERR